MQVLLQSNEDLSEAEEEKKPFFEDKAYIEDDSHLQLQDDECDPPVEDDFDPYVEDDDHLELQSPEPEKLEPQHQDYEHSPELQHQDHEQSSEPPKAQMPEPEQDEQFDTADTDTPLLESESKR